MNDTLNIKEMTISASEKYMLHDDDAYRVASGSVYAFLVREMDNGNIGSILFLCEISDSDAMRTIPGIKYRDESFRNWRIVITSRSGDAEVVHIPDARTRILDKKFAALCKIDEMTYAEEGFGPAIVELYQKQENAGKALILKNELAPEAVSKDIFNAAVGIIRPGPAPAPVDDDNYKALHFVCSQLGVGIISAEDLKVRCGKNPDVLSIAKASRCICRKIVLDAFWYKSDCGGFVGKLDKEIIACVPDKHGRYQLYRTSDDSVTPLTPEIAEKISPQAYSVGRTLPMRVLNKKDVLDFCKKSVHAKDLVPYTVLVLACALVGVLLPTLNQMVYDDYIPVGKIGNLAQICLLMLTFMIGNVSFSIVKNLFSFRITSRVGGELQNAVYHRLFHLPESFFRDYDSADLAERVSGIGTIATSFANTIIITGISALFSIVYLIRMFKYSGKMSWFAILMYAIYLVLIVWITSLVHKGRGRIAEADSEASSKLYQYLNGVDKIRMAGVEERALLSYIRPYARKQSEEIKVNRLTAVEETLTSVVKSIFSMVLYYIIVKNKIELSIGAFVAFNTAFGSFTGALDELVNQALALMQERSEIKRFWPIFEAKPEDDDNKEVVKDIRGEIALEHVTFAYTQGGKNVLNDLSLKIKDGEYVGIVGSSGCGKSTLLKLLLGFETPQSGIVLIDGKDLSQLDKGAYRRKLGVVLQNGKLISGSIQENITITAPEANLARVNKVIEMVGLKEDIAQMPMGINTMLSETSNTISGGQQQRILIARAICGDPKILIFDEATSALDNLTQAKVTESLDKMKLTRIVVAHRLSTIKNCDRILVLDKGSVVEEGNYETLMAKKGLFYALASRQIAE